MKRELSTRTSFTLWKSRAMTIVAQLIHDAKKQGNTELQEELEQLMQLLWRSRRRGVVNVVHLTWELYKKHNLEALLDILPPRDASWLFNYIYSDNRGE